MDQEYKKVTRLWQYYGSRPLTHEERAEYYLSLGRIYAKKAIQGEILVQERLRLNDRAAYCLLQAANYSLQNDSTQ